MSSPLYSREILRLAASLAGQKRLDNPGGTADLRSPTCGSRVIIDVALNTRGIVGECGIDARACALGQASAALVAAHVTGKSPEELQDASTAMRAFLAGERGASGIWPGIEVFEPARAYPARHPSILLAFEAAAQAAHQAQVAA